MIEEKPHLYKLDQRLNQVAYWLPLIPFTVSAGIYPLGEPRLEAPFVLVGNSRRAVFGWQQALAGLDLYLVVVDTGGQSLTTALESRPVIGESLAASVCPDIEAFWATLAEAEDEPDKPSLFLPLLPDLAGLADELAALTGLSVQWLPAYPPAAAETLRFRSEEAEKDSPRSPGPGRHVETPPLDTYPRAFNLALFISPLTLGLSLAVGSAYSWLWLLLPWLACLGAAMLPARWPGLGRGLLWGLVLSLPLVAWQTAAVGWDGAIRWGLAALLLGAWAGWRTSVELK